MEPSETEPCDQFGKWYSQNHSKKTIVRFINRKNKKPENKSIGIKKEIHLSYLGRR